MTRRLFGLLFLALMVAARAGDHYQPIAEFTAGDKTLAVRVEYRADGDRRGILWMKSGPHSGVMIFRPAEWQQVLAQSKAAIARARKLSPGQSALIAARLPAASGSYLRVEAERPVRAPGLKLTRLDGGKLSNGQPAYPDIAYSLTAADLSEFQSALERVEREIRDKN